MAQQSSSPPISSSPPQETSMIISPIKTTKISNFSQQSMEKSKNHKAITFKAIAIPNSIKTALLIGNWDMNMLCLNLYTNHKGLLKISNALRWFLHARSVQFKWGKDYLCMAIRRLIRLFGGWLSIGRLIKAAFRKKTL